MIPITRVQEVAIIAVIAASAVIVFAAPFALLGAGASWRDRAQAALGVLEALIVAARRVLGL